MGPVAKALAERGIPPSLILTGQHPHLDLVGCGLARFPAFSLGCAGQPEPHRHVQHVFDSLFPFLRRRPDLVMVQGDTSSAMGAALAAVAARVPLAHVEAGLRSHDAQQPWPEEEYRRRIDAEADLLFAPTETAAQNLRREHVPGAIFITGNTGVDALVEVTRGLPPVAKRVDDLFRILVTCHRRESWGGGLSSLAQALRTLADDGGLHIELILHPNPEVAERFRSLLGDLGNLALTSPCSHAALVDKMRCCDLLLSDSGGVQEEAPVLGTPLLVLRDKTERPEGIASGNAELVGMHSDTIVRKVRELRRDRLRLAGMARPALPYGDGTAAVQISAIVEEWIGSRMGSRLLAG